jgi:dienelactone hydrolase
VVGVPRIQGASLSQDFLERLLVVPSAGASSSAGPSKVVVGGHSAGGAAAIEMCCKQSLSARFCGLITVNAAHATPDSAAVHVPAMYIVGENDPSIGSFNPPPTFGDDLALTATVRRADDTSIVMARGADHSLRFNRSSQKEDKDFAATSPQTIEMNRAVAKDIATFICGL